MSFDLDKVNEKKSEKIIDVFQNDNYPVHREQFTRFGMASRGEAEIILDDIADVEPEQE